MDNNLIDNGLEVLNNIKKIKYLDNTEFLTTQMVADYFEINKDTIDTLIKRNKEELISNGLKILTGKEVKELINNDTLIINLRGHFEYCGQKFANRTNVIISKRVLCYIGLLLIDSPIAIKLKQKLGIGKKVTERKEIDFLNQLEQSLKPFDIQGIRQYSILSYRIDFYIPSLNIAIEYDENNHDNYTYEQHEGRQEEIEKELGCKFIRVSDKNSNEYNIGYVIKNIFNL